MANTGFSFGKQLRRLFGAGTKLDEQTKEQLEELLISSDTGMAACSTIIAQLDDALSRSKAAPVDCLRQLLVDRLTKLETPLLPESPTQMHTLLVVGTNGSGKTTTLAKLAHWYGSKGYNPIFAAGDTFRAAAVEQLTRWGDRLGMTTIAHQPGADSASVIFDAIEAASARGKNLVLADTAGRLHNKTQLLAELEKIHRVAAKANPNNTIHNLLVLDAASGLSALQTLSSFAETLPIAGIVVTKLDGSAKGGVLLALSETAECKVPFIGTGETLQDFQPFKAPHFVDRLLQP